ncbi:DUF2946 family protein [Rhodomicrobium sp.]|uniref:DUF2946 family protein n=1 Tax=Rhodomicrobium sp. TaxID=2720632 RepID=UPI0039E4A43A
MRRAYDTSVDPLHGARLREMAVALGLFAILLNLVSGLAFGFKPAGLAERALANGWTVICSGADIRVLDQNGEPVSLPHDGKPHCAFCLPLMHGSAIPARDMAIAPRTVSVDVLSPLTSPACVSFCGGKLVWPRAPPQAAIG